MKSFVKVIIIETLIIILVGVFPFLSWGRNYVIELTLAFGLSLFNAFVGYFIVIKSISLENNLFYRNVYGGMLVRMVFMLGFALYMILNGFVQTVPFFLSLMIFYVIHQWTEISSWMKILPSRKVSAS
ncbi:MAG: hypothetical protein ISR90_00570 [Candidatus Marinimicrobia bacterium]|nr:hypothetical protein [Candidatus Neomarinimicrobiota bacterium]MBL7022536.1 hypothetical protein [Candidatus Neomarinimicrobiota bacterium]MBL7108892.1 hypothetical protein [Candidatus Neomarinimicrobiota bacterium]